jgi:hypothetical protein
MLRNKHLFLAALNASMSAGGLASMSQNPIAAAAAAVASSVPSAEPLAPVLRGDLMEPLSDEALEQRVEAAKPTAPRITKEHIQSLIVDETYTRLEGTNTTVCRLELANGFCVVGINNGPVSAANYNQEIGCEYAYKGAVEQIWPLEGYLLAERLHAGDVHAEKLEKLRNLVAVQCTPGTIDQGEYMRGMANGLILAVAVFDGQEPTFHDAPTLTHQERVVLERAELDARANRLEDFISGEKFPELAHDEQARLLAQHSTMTDYSRILAERIAAF